jgi:hypothetical protein
MPSPPPLSSLMQATFIPVGMASFERAQYPRIVGYEGVRVEGGGFSKGGGLGVDLGVAGVGSILSVGAGAISYAGSIGYNPSSVAGGFLSTAAFEQGGAAGGGGSYHFEDFAPEYGLLENDWKNRWEFGTEEMNF